MKRSAEGARTWAGTERADLPGTGTLPGMANPTKRVHELKRLLDELLATAANDLPNEADLRSCLDGSVANFVRGGPQLLDEATSYLWAYYLSFAGSFSAEERAACGIPELPDSIDIWDEVDFEHPPEIDLGRGRYSPAPSYISFEGEVSWEREHGLQLVFEHGRRVCKVGPYDGHPTNAHAYADESLLDVVFK